ncbi:MAG: chromosome segregation protein SMC, partial [Treponema sp.]|nr:chromosome segregation protein SMC [Treponema sp.]
KDTGFSENAMNNAKEKLETIIKKLKIFADGRKNIFSDFAKTGKHNAEESKRISEESASAFSETLSLIEELNTALDEYVKSSPAFITEFLSPKGIITQKREIDTKIQKNKETENTILLRIKDLTKSSEQLSKKITEYKDLLGKLKINEAQMKEQMNADEGQLAILRRSKVQQQNSLSQAENDIQNEEQKNKLLSEQIESTQEEINEIDAKGQKLANELKALDEEINKYNSNVSGKKNALQKKQEEQNKLQGQYEKFSLSLASSDTEIKNIKQNFQDIHSRDLMEFEERMYKITKPLSDLKDALFKSKEELKNLGQVNFMAVEEFSEVKERYERQQSNYDDTKKSLENLQRVSEEIKSKSSEIFLDTYNKIKKNFHNMFRRLFNGGRAELRLIDPDNVLTSGINIFAQPPGKKLENIALLSGGEKTMTAIALLFATYQVRPSPFCLLDEIDAALDDKNVSSFVTALRSFANVSQYIVITHNKRTAKGASTLLGITMEESGVSKILALRLDKDLTLGDTIDENPAPSEEEDVPEEKGVIPPRPAKRIHNPDGTITDPDLEKAIKKEKELEKEARQKLKKEKASNEE